MYIDFTSKQYSFILHALTIMITFYSNDFSSICKEVGEAYGASEADIASACATLTAINVTAPVKSYSDKCSEILEDMLHHARELPEKDAPYKYSIGLDTPSWKVVADALDTYSRILMGQFGVIYEALDISGNDGVGDHIISFLDICAMRGQLVLAKAPSIPAINNKTVYCTGAHKHGEDRCIVLDGEKYSQILFVDGTIKLCWQ